MASDVPLIRPSPLNELPLDRWKETLVEMGIKEAVLSETYSPGQALMSRAYESSEKCKRLRIKVPEFDPSCV